MSNNDNRAAARQFVQDELARKKWTRARLASEADIDPKTLRAFLDGSRWPQAETREAVSRALGWMIDEIDHIENSGEHRYTVVYVNKDDRSDVRHREVRTTWAQADLVRRYISAVEFASIAEMDASLQEPAGRFVDAATDLWQAAGRVLRGCDGNAERSSASIVEVDDDREVSEETPRLRNVAKPGGLEPEDGDLNVP